MEILTFDKFIDEPMSNTKAYILGLVLPKIVIGQSKKTGGHFLLGQINHGYQNKPTEDDILDHYLSLDKYFKKNSMSIKIAFKDELKSFSISKMSFSSIRGIGFTICLPLDNSNRISFNENNINDNLIEEIRFLLIQEAEKINKEQAPYFIAATIDGRSSVDTTMKCVSLDVDTSKDLNKCLHDLTENIAGMDINLNDRSGRTDATRMNQLRYKQDSMQDYFNKHKDLLHSRFRRKKIKEVIL